MTMKRFLMLLTSVLFCINMGAQEGYHNTTAGKTLKWSIHDGDDKLFGYCHETLVSMEGDETNARIDYSYMFYDSSNQPVIASPFEFYATISDGKTSAYVNDVAKARKSGDYLPVGDLSSIPDNLAVGKDLPNTEIQVKVLTVFTAKNLYNNRHVTAKETVSVPAGSFECFLVEDDETFTGSGPYHVKTWVAKGIGIVRQIIYKKDGSVNQTFELIK